MFSSISIFLYPLRGWDERQDLSHRNGSEGFPGDFTSTRKEFGWLRGAAPTFGKRLNTTGRARRLVRRSIHPLNGYGLQGKCMRSGFGMPHRAAHPLSLITKRAETQHPPTADSGIRQQGWHRPTAVRGDPGLLQELPDIAALLSEGGADREQAAAADAPWRE